MKRYAFQIKHQTELGIQRVYLKINDINTKVLKHNHPSAIPSAKSVWCRYAESRKKG